MKAKKAVKNDSGIKPKGDRVLVLPDPIEETSEGGIVVITESQMKLHENAQAVGTFIAAGPDAWIDIVEIKERYMDGSWKKVERTTKGSSEPYALPGERVAFASYAGRKVFGADGTEYRILNDRDITVGVGEGVSFTDIRARKPL